MPASKDKSRNPFAHPEQCFELLGLDIMLDSQLNPWLIECNRTPSLTTEYSGNLKLDLLKDALGLILSRRQVLAESASDETSLAPMERFGNFALLFEDETH